MQTIRTLGCFAPSSHLQSSIFPDGHCTHWSTLHSHWSRNVEARHSLVESFIVLHAPAVLCHKEPARASKRMGVFCVPKPLVGCFGCPSWFFMTNPRNSPRHRGGPVWLAQTSPPLSSVSPYRAKVSSQHWNLTSFSPDITNLPRQTHRFPGD